MKDFIIDGIINLGLSTIATIDVEGKINLVVLKSDAEVKKELIQKVTIPLKLQETYEAERGERTTDRLVKSWSK